MYGLRHSQTIRPSGIIQICAKQTPSYEECIGRRVRHEAIMDSNYWPTCVSKLRDLVICSRTDWSPWAFLPVLTCHAICEHVNCIKPVLTMKEAA